MATEGRVAIITGSSQGIGAVVAEQLAADGLAVVINYSSKASLAEELVKKIEGAGGRAIAIGGDVSDPAAVAQLLTQTSAASGGVDVLINNAGIMKLAVVAETTDELFDQTMAINLKAVFNGMREAAKRCARAAGSSASLPAWSGFTSRPTPPTPPPRPASKR